MKQYKFQSKVAGSELTLPICILVAIALWWLPEGTFSLLNILGLALCLLMTYVIMGTNTQLHIIRIRTHLMACVWLLLSACFPFMHPIGEPLIAASCLCISYLLLFLCYQRLHPQAYVFHVFLMLSLGSLCAPVMLPMAVLFYLYLIIFLRSITWKAFWAGILGLTAPYWCYAVWCFIDPLQTSPSMASLPIVLSLEELSWKGFPLPFTFTEKVSAGGVALLSIVSIIHYLSTRYDDKIRARMILYIYIMQTLLMMVYMVLQPAHYQTTMALLVASASPLIAHYLALSRGILSGLLFILSLLLVAAIGVLNLWMTSFSI